MFIRTNNIKPENVAIVDGANITSKTNASRPTWGGVCHTLSTDSRNYLIIRVRKDENMAKDNRRVMR